MMNCDQFTLNAENLPLQINSLHLNLQLYKKTQNNNFKTM